MMILTDIVHIGQMFNALSRIGQNDRTNEALDPGPNRHVGPGRQRVEDVGAASVWRRWLDYFLLGIINYIHVN